MEKERFVMLHDTLPLSGFTILVVEDEPLIALDIATTLEDAGAVVIGPCLTVAHAMSLIVQTGRQSPLNGAVLDVDLGKETSIPIAHRLQEMGVRFLFHTGVHSGTAALLKGIDAPVIRKPSTGANLISGVAAELGIRSGT